jgi:hypothetical protein
VLRAGFSRTSEDGTQGPRAPEGSGAAREGSKAAEISGGAGDGSRECVLEQRLRDLGRALTAADEAQRVLAERAAAASPQPAPQVSAAGGTVGEAEGSEPHKSPAAGSGSRRERWLEGRVKVGALPSAPPARAREGRGRATRALGHSAQIEQASGERWRPRAKEGAAGARRWRRRWRRGGTRWTTRGRWSARWRRARGARRRRSRRRAHRVCARQSWRSTRRSTRARPRPPLCRLGPTEASGGCCVARVRVA